MRGKWVTIAVTVLMTVAFAGQPVAQAAAASGGATQTMTGKAGQKQVTNAMRKAAAARLKAKGVKARAALSATALANGAPTATMLAPPASGMTPKVAAKAPLATPDYFGTTPNYANSSLPPVVIFTSADGLGSGADAVASVANGGIEAIVITNGGSGYDLPPLVDVVGLDGSGAGGFTVTVANGAVTGVTVANPGAGYGGIRKFVDSLAGLGSGGANDLGQYIPIAVPDTTTYPGADYYVIEVGQYSEKLSSDLPPTLLRGYHQVNSTDSTVTRYSYLGPLIIAQKDRVVRVKFINSLPTGAGGDLFLPVDTSVMGSGEGPLGPSAGNYTQNRATLHLHGGNTPWISDGTEHQWITPAGETTAYPKGVSVQNVPDMADPGPGAQTFYYTNQQSARLMFYHDHSYGITRLNVYAGEAAGYVLTDPAEQDLVNGTNTTGVNPTNLKVIPTDQIPLVIQDKTFVPAANQLAAEDPTWADGGTGGLWYPHVYMPNQNPSDLSGASAMGRWDYGPWFWPPFTGITNGEVPNPLADPANPKFNPAEPAMMPGTPNPSIVPEGFMDTPLVNGTVYPFAQVGQKAYRFRILNASNDRTINLQLYYAKSNGSMWKVDANGQQVLNDANAGEVPMVAAVKTVGFPATWPTDGRDGGVPDPKAAGPSMIQIGTEGGFLPQAVSLPNQPVDYEYNRRSITVLNVSSKTLMLGPAERADVIVDFSQVPAGSKLILYNDAPAPVPAFDPRYDYYTGDPDQTSTGGAPTTLPGYGPNTRTLMQFQVQGSLASTLSLTSGGTGYASPSVSFSGGGGTGAAATTSGTVEPLKLAAGGSGYSAPVVGFSGGNGSGVAATVSGAVDGLTVTSGGSGYSNPSVSISSISGTGAAATASGGVSGLALASPGAGFTAPAVGFSGGGGSGAAATVSGGVDSVLVTSPGTGFTAPLVAFNGGGGTGAAATASFDPITGAITNVVVTSSGTGYTSAPAVTIAEDPTLGGTGSGALTSSTINLTTIIPGAPGSLYTSAPSVAITDSVGTGSGAAVSATINVTALALTVPGSGYSTAPSVTISDTGAGSGATASATLTVTGVALSSGGNGYTSAPVAAITDSAGTGSGASLAPATLHLTAITLTSAGTGYMSAPTVTIADTTGSGTGATATATLVAAVGAPFSLANLMSVLPTAYAKFQPAPIVPQANYNAAFAQSGPVDAYVRIQDTSMSFFNGPLTGLTLTKPGSGYTSPPVVAIVSGGGGGALATAVLAPAAVQSLTLTNGGSGFSTAPAVSISGGGGSGATATATLATRSVLSAAVTAAGSGYTALPAVTFSGGGGSGAAATAIVTNRRVSSIIVTNGGTGYTAAPTLTISGGGGSGAKATATLATAKVQSLTLTKPGSGYTSSPAVSFTGGGGTGVIATAALAPAPVASLILTNGGTGFTSAPAISISGGGGTGATAKAVGVVMQLQPKSIIEDFDPSYGRMDAMLGVEIPKTTATNATSLPYWDTDPATEIIKASDAAAPIGSLADGTQIWKITHNGVDTHAIHWHMFDVQLINRVGWDGAVKPPDANELGWKDTVRMNPLEDAIVALRPILPKVPFDLPNSIRPLDVTAPLGVAMPNQFHNVDPINEPATVINTLVNYGWEYVWHCHLLGHEENVMMRPMIIGVAPKPASGLNAVAAGRTVTLTFIDSSINETGFTVNRATSPSGPWTTVKTGLAGNVAGTGPVSYLDSTVARRTTYFYSVTANNVVGYTQAYAAPTRGYPHPSFDSATSNIVPIVTP
jgi:FtsP/CotA-like multicopper oxidase with cupredoxin domain